MAKERLDIKQHVTDTIIEQIEAGTPPWRKPWTGGTSGIHMPMRHNGEAYRGINVLMLWAMATKKRFSSSRWMTFKQARDLGGCVCKGETSSKTVYYGTFEKDPENGSGEVETHTSRFAKAFSVFNADQIDGLPDEYYILPDPPRDLGTETDPELEAFFASIGVPTITTTEPRAYYNIEKDQIHMPPVETFHSAAGYYGTLAHENIHAVGSGSRLNRLETFRTTGDTAKEELIAEIGACFLAVQLGIDPQFDQSAAYVESWLTCLKSDKSFIFKAAAEAQKAVDYINAATALEAVA